MPLSVPLVLLYAALAGPAVDEARSSDDLGAAQQRPSVALVDAEGLSTQAWIDELDLRIPDLELRTSDATQPRPEAPFVYIHARRDSGGLHRVTLVFSDGRAYYETVDVGEAGSPERVLAASVANLLLSIDSGAVQPDQVGVELPSAAPSSEGDGLPSDADEAAEPESEPEPASDAEEARPTSPGLELALSLGLGQATALGQPRFADAHLGLSGSLELALRAASGLYASAEFRPGGVQQATSSYRLTRFTVGLGLGYAWRWAAVELPLVVVAQLSPWLVTSEGRVEPVVGLDVDGPARPPLFAVGLRASPGYRVVVERGALDSLRIGPRMDLTGGFVLSSPPRVAGLQGTDGTSLFRLGGAELYIGLELALWFKRSRPRGAR